MRAESIIAANQPSITGGLGAMLAPAKPAKRQQVRFIMDREDQALEKAEREESEKPQTLSKALQGILNGGKHSIERLAFETDPSYNNFKTLYKPKLRGVPDTFIKRLMIQDDLVAAIIRARATQASAFGRPRHDRFKTGYEIEPHAGVLDKLNPEQKKELGRRIEEAVRRFETCGDTDGLQKKDMMSFTQYLQMSTPNAVGLGRIATEIVHVDQIGGEPRFHHFRPIDVGTIYRATPQKSAEDQVREQARHLLEQIKNKKIEPERFLNDEYAWAQVIEGTVRQFFTDDEVVCHTFYPTLDIEQDGYPITPIDTMISAVTTHINITKHNQIYFQTGRASRGMLVFRSDDVDENVLARVKQQFQASINSVNNAWRMPVFAVSSNDEISWEPIDNSSRDAEFQYLTDMNARVILSAFMMSPEELPGWAYLSKGTSNQSLSESNNEYRLEAARDLGIRPLLAQWEDFINANLFPLIDPMLAKLCRFQLLGLDADTEEKESVRLQQDMPVHGTYDWVMEKVEKPALGKEWGGEFPLNPQWQSVVDKYLTVGSILEKFFGIEGASKDPSLQYRRDPFYFQQLQIDMQKQQMQMQAQQATAAPPGGGGSGGAVSGPGGGPGGGTGGDTGGDTSSDDGGDDSAPPAGGSGEADLTRSIDQAIALLTKNEQQLPASKRKLLAMTRRTLDRFRNGWEEDLRDAMKDIVAVADKHASRN